MLSLYVRTSVTRQLQPVVTGNSVGRSWSKSQHTMQLGEGALISVVDHMVNTHGMDKTGRSHLFMHPVPI